MKIVISAESTIDLPKNLLEAYNIKTVPFIVTLKDKTGFDGEITTQEIIDSVNETNVLPKTSAVNRYQFETFFKELLEEYDHVIHFSLSSSFSSAYSNAIAVSEELKNVTVIDSRTLSTGIALLAIYAQKLNLENNSVDEIVSKVSKRISFNQTSFILKRLDYLYKGGRCNALSYLGATLLKIRPQIIVSDGDMKPKKKYVGKIDVCVRKYVNDCLKEFNNPDLSNVFITYTTMDLDVIVEVKKTLIARGFKNIMITTANATVTSHCGEGCLGILYLNDGDNHD